MKLAMIAVFSDAQTGHSLSLEHKTGTANATRLIHMWLTTVDKLTLVILDIWYRKNLVHLV